MAIFKRGAALRSIDYRAALLERAAACSAQIARASDPDQRALLENVQEMWRALADDCERYSEHELTRQIERIATLHNDILAMDRSPRS